MYQRILHYEKCIVGRQCEGVRGDAGARFDCISDGLPPVLQRVRKSEDRIRISGVDCKGACDRIVQQYCGECNAIAAVPHSIQKRRIVPRQVKHTDDFVECSQVNCDRRKIRAASDQTCNLRRNRTVGGREITGCGLIAKPRSYSAAERLEPYLYRIVQAVVAGIISPKRNDRPDSIMLHQSHNRLRFACIVRAEAKDIVVGDCQRRSGAALTDHKNIVRIRKRLNHRNLRARLRSDDNLHAATVQVPDRVERL